MSRFVYQVEESVSGETRKVRAISPVEAVKRYLKDEVEVNPNGDEWVWEFHVTRPSRKKNYGV